MLNRGTALEELLKVPVGIVGLIYYSWDLLAANLIQAPSQTAAGCSAGRLAISIGLPWVDQGFSLGKKVPGSSPKGSLCCGWWVPQEDAGVMHGCYFPDNFHLPGATHSFVSAYMGFFCFLAGFFSPWKLNVFDLLLQGAPFLHTSTIR